MRDQRAEVSLNIAPDERYESAELEPRAFRILVVGDFSARGDDAVAANDTPRRVDRDDLDTHLSRIAPRLRVEIDGQPLDLAFTSMDDFLPDRLAQRVSMLDRGNDRAAPDAPIAKQAADIARTPVDLGRAVSGGSLLDDMLDEVPGTPRRADDLSAFVERAVAPHLVRPPDPETAARDAATVQATTRLLRAVLHDPRVQALEASWQSLDLLVRRLDTDGDLALFLLDVPRAGVAATLERLAQQRGAASGEEWALVVSLHTVADGDAGAQWLAGVAMAARALDAPIIAGAPASFAGRSSATSLDDDSPPGAAPEVFTLIRRSLEARFLGLTFPRVLLRVPFGSENPCDTIAFEELEDPSRHDDYLWGSGAVLVALLVGEAFNARGWAIGPRMPLDVGSLPLFTYRRGPETVATPCAETIMSERVARQLLSRGLMPLAWIKNTDRVRLVELRSVAEPTAPLAAEWAGTASGSSA
jgi:hypothetical protein